MKINLYYNLYHHQTPLLFSISNLPNPNPAQETQKKIKRFIAEAQWLAEQKQVKTERKLQKLRIQEEQFKLQQQLEKIKVLKGLKDAKIKVETVKMLEQIDEKQSYETSFYCLEV